MSGSPRFAAADAETLESLLGRMASATSAAGGGAAAALAGAAAAALVAMVAGIAARHAPGDARLPAVAEEARTLSRRLGALIALDEDAYAQVLEARRSSADGALAVRRALRRATEVPLEVAGASVAVLTHAAAIVDAARRAIIGDLGVAAALAGAALEAAVLTARINLAEVDDSDFVHDTGQALERLLTQGMTVRRRLAEVIAARAPGGATPPR